MKTELTDCCQGLKEALLVLAEAGYPTPGTADGEISYVLKHDCKGNLTGVDVVVSDKAMGAVLACLTEE